MRVRCPSTVCRTQQETAMGVGGNRIIVMSSLRKVLFSECLTSTLKRKAGVFKFLRLRFRDGLVWTVDLTAGTTLRFQIALV